MNFQKAKTLAIRCQELGPLGAVQLLAHAARVKLDMAALETLRLVFGFDRWHSRSPDSARPYRAQISALVNKLDPASVVEVGCGLGGILSRINAERRHGYDQDPAAIRAARFLHGPSVEFTVGGFEQVDDDRIDVLIAVNWMHGFSSEQVEQWISPLLPKARYLLVDTIIPGAPGNYPFLHNFEFLGDKARQLRVESVASEPHRRFILWEITH